MAPITLRAAADADLDRVRHAARDLTAALGFSPHDAEAVVLAAAELANNLVRYAEGGEIVLAPVDGPRGRGLRLESRDRGPGIASVDLAMKDGFSTGGGLGHGLPGARRLMDDFEIETDPTGTRIVAHKWVGA